MLCPSPSADFHPIPSYFFIENVEAESAQIKLPLLNTNLNLSQLWQYCTYLTKTSYGGVEHLLSLTALVRTLILPYFGTHKIFIMME